MFLADYHVHPGFSIDAQDVGIHRYCRRALDLKLDEICFTPHLELDPARSHLDWFVRIDGVNHPMEDLRWLDIYFKQADSARDIYGPMGLGIKTGIEIGYDRGLEERIRRIVEEYPFDFVLGSVHCLEHQSIASGVESKGYFPGRKLSRVMDEYYKTLSEGVQSGFFDCMGHLDIYCRYGFKYYGDDVLRAHRGLVEPVLEAMAEKNIGLEINTSGPRRGLGQYHPGQDILGLALAAGVKIFTAGSDAHSLRELGYHIRESHELLRGLGGEIYTFNRREPRVVA